MFPYLRDSYEERLHKALGYLSPINYSALRPELYPQMVNGNDLQIEENRLVDKADEEEKLIELKF